MHVASFLKVEEGKLIQEILTSNKKKEVLYSRNLEISWSVRMSSGEGLWSEEGVFSL